MSTYKQLTYEQRCQIEALKRSRIPQSAIAQVLGVSQSTISREIRRNSGERGYRHQQAQRKSVQRRRSTHVPHKMTRELVAIIEQRLRQDWSPEQISGRLLIGERRQISHERIYQHIWLDKQAGGDLHQHLRRKSKPYQRRGSNGKTSRGQIRNRVSIDERPASVEARDEAGHWEIDTVIGKGHSGALVTLVERVTRYTLSRRINRKQACEVSAATIEMLSPYKALVRSITSDNGKEFAHHEEMAQKLGCDFYFAHPYHSWERGLNENTNGLLRQDFPKGTDFQKVTAREVERAIVKLNGRPRKVLGFRTPAESMADEMAAMAA